MKISITRASFALLAGGFAACTSPSSRPPLPGPQPPPADQAAAQDSPAMAIDRALRAEIPSYVGLGFGLDGQLLVTLANEADIAAAQQLTDKVWSRAATERGYTPVRRPRFEAIIAPMGPQDLATAFATMRDVLTLPNVVFLDLDEVCGCIAVGISNASAEAAVSAFATQRGLQQGGVRIVLTAPIVRLQSLRARFRPTVGGIEITAGIGGAFCTLGLPVYHFGQSRAGFLTASHCTNQQGGEESTLFFQEAAPTPGSITAGTPAEPQAVALEAADPPLFDQSSNAACPTGRRCRYSDVAFAAYLEPNAGRIGRMARPASSCGAMTCALAMTRSTDDIRVILASSGAFVGDTIHKIGRTTGWTSGRVSRACVNENVVDANLSDTGITLLCQYTVDAPSIGGDSGSPVFLFNPARGAASFEGLLWGGAAAGPSNFFTFSPVAGIQREFGSIVFNQQGLASPFLSNGRFYTSNFDDDIEVVVERGAVPADQVEFVLNGGSRITAPKEIVLVEGTNPPATGNGRWTVSVTRNGDTDRNGLYLYQLPGGHLEFRRREPGSNAMIEVSRVPIDNIAPGTRVTFTWERD